MSGGRAAGLLPLAAVAAPASAQPLAVVPDEYRWLSFAVFAAIVGLTLLATYAAARRVRTPTDFYTTGGGVSGMQNGWAIAGDYLSSASFLGTTGLIALWGYDGFMYSVGWLVAYAAVLLLIAEPCRNIGRYTLSDILAYRNDPRKARILGALSVVTVSACYLVAQMVGAGVLVKTLIGIDYEISVIAVGVLMLAYVVFGGMVATTWVQIVKAVLLVAASLAMVALVWRQYGFLDGFFAQVVADAGVHKRVAAVLGDAAAGMTPEELGRRFLEPGLLFATPIDQISLGVALVFGTAGLPHILMRFFTVPTARAARMSVVWAMVIIGGFYVLTLFLGLGAALKVGAPAIAEVDAGGNMAAPLLAQALGGGPESLFGNLMLALVAAAAFATIIAVVAGLVLAAASAIAHDLYVGVVRNGRAGAEEQVRAARVAAALFGGLAILLGIAAKGQNVAHLVALTFAVAASANFPAVFMTLFWRRCNTGGVVAGMVVGAVAAVGLILVSPNMTYPKTVVAAAQQVLDEAPARLALIEKALAADDPERVEQAKKERAALGRAVARARDDIERHRQQTTSLVGLEAPWFGLRNPGLVSVPLGFLAVIVGSLLYRDPRAAAMWDEVRVRRHLGVLAAGRRPPPASGGAPGQEGF
ncbi:MAG: cation/acetate symporter ActP [Rhodocyclaceae bacterium]|nr:cation/acetate symporter ActP [Rhodocyclaceae bacterium]